MTSDAVTADFTDHQPLHCYRHPDRETWVRCGRCDQPICTGCAMQGPVGLRCKTCGKPSRDPMSAMTARQLVLGGLVALVTGTLGGAVGVQAGFFFAICLGPVAGRLICEAVMRVTGYKRGPKMYGIVGGGIVAGALVGAAFYALTFLGSYGVEPEMIGPILNMAFVNGIVYVVAALIGAFSRFRF